jgi:prolyl oligopeptidase
MTARPFLCAAAFVAALFALPSCSGPSSRSTQGAPPPLTNEYHGVQVVDRFAWLENANAPAVREWTAAQNSRAREHLDHLPARADVAEELKRLYASTSPNYYALTWRPGRLFLMKFEPPAQQPVLMVMSSVTNLKSAKVIVDPNKLSAAGAKVIDWYVPSLDGKLVAVSMSEKGSEDGTLHFFDTETGRELPDRLPRVQYPTGGGSAAWNADGTGIYYTRYPSKGERPDADLHFYQQVYFHKLGTPVEQDKWEFGRDLPKIAAIDLEASRDGKYLLASVADGDGGDYAHYLRGADGVWKQIAGFKDRVKRVEFGRDPLYIELGRNDALYLLSTKNAPRGEILRMKYSELELSKAKVVVKESTNTIRDFKPTASGVAIVYLKGGPMELVYRDFFNQAASGPSSRSTSPDFKIPTSVGQILVTHGDEILFRSETFTEPFTWWRYDTNRDRDRPSATPLRGRAPVSFADVEAVRVSTKSKDGTRVPMTILRRKGTRLTGDLPTILTGYGGYGISRVPNYDVARRVWIDQGGVIAIANLRGGGEFGEEWHKAGNLTRKQNVFDDFIACAEFLVRSNYTNPQRLAIEGGSNGGLLMGAMLTQRPELFRAVVSHVGVYDMLRVELDPNGQFNTTEFGTVKDREQFHALYAYSPYHRVQDRTAFPAVLMLTGEHDGRVNPAHSKKMTARLQAANASRHPILLRTSSTSGHGIGTALSERVAQLSDVYAFLMHQLGIEHSLISRGPLSGGVTPTSAVVKAKLAREGLPARLLVSKDPQFTKPLHTPAVLSDTNEYNVVKFDVSGLEPSTQYYYALEVNGRVDRKKTGEFKTFPAGPASFHIAFASCGRTGSTRDVFDRIREHRPLFYMNMGDFHYEDISTNNLSLFRAAYDRVLASPQQAELYRTVPLIYMWDDHDYGGNNASVKSKTGNAARTAYEDYVPHYPLPTTNGPIYHSFTVGRAKFIVTDLRSARSDPKDPDGPKKTMMGAAQKAWFKQELLSAKGKYPLIFWMTTVPYIGEVGKSPYRNVKTNQWGFIHHTNLVTVKTNAGDTLGANADANSDNPSKDDDKEEASANGGRTNGTSVASAPTSGSRTNAASGSRRGNNNPNGGGGDEDHWSAFAYERREIADFIKSNNIAGVAILHGDSHMMAADDGRNADYATGGGAPIPVMCAGPLDQNPSLKGGPYSHGVYRVRDRDGESGFGLLYVEDKGDVIHVTYSGRNNKNVEAISLKFSVPATSKLAAKQ